MDILITIMIALLLTIAIIIGFLSYISRMYEEIDNEINKELMQDMSHKDLGLW